MTTFLWLLLRSRCPCGLDEKGQGGAAWIVLLALLVVVLVILFCCFGTGQG